jgi:hypothetical protein
MRGGFTMGIGIAITITFLVVFCLVYGAMKLACFFKKEYGQAENFIFRLMTYFMCESCRKACESPAKLFIRAVTFAALITAVGFGVAYFIR